MSAIQHSLDVYLGRVSERYPIEAAYLFGSYAYGQPTSDSDIDVAIVSSGFTGDYFRDNVSLGVMTWGVDTRIEAVGYRPEDFNEDRLLPNEIINKGIRIFPKSPNVVS